MEANMNARIFYAAAPLALLLATGANAQIVYQSPMDLTQDQQTTVYRTIVRENTVPQMRPVSRKTTRQVVRTTPSGKVVRTTTTERLVPRNAPIVAATERVVRQPQQRVIATQPTTTFVTSDPLDLSQDQRTVVYRTLVQPAPVVTSPQPYMAARPYLTTTPDGRRIISTIDPVFGERVITTTPSTTGVGTVVTAPGGYSEIAIGSRIPSSIPIYAMPIAAATAAPALAGYNYALIDNRVYLVDPRDGIVVGMLYQ
jgi:hypothetical protein